MLEYQMSLACPRLEASSARLHSVRQIAAELTVQLAELKELRNRVKWAAQP
jgi:hypothetical protein